MTEVESLRAELERADELLMKFYIMIVRGDPPRWPLGVEDATADHLRRYAHSRYNPLERFVQWQT